MNKLSDIFKKSFLEGYSNADINVGTVAIVLLITFAIGIYIFWAYRLITRKTFYSKNFNIALVGVALITAAIIVTIQSSVVVSLGMVGALSIVRFRTAIKEPMDLMFLFWAISAGIMCGAGFAEYAVLLCLMLTLVLVVLEFVPTANAPMILIVNATDLMEEKELSEVISKSAKHFKVKSRNISKGKKVLTIEIRTSNGDQLVSDLMKCDHIINVSLLEHNGDITY